MIGRLAGRILETTEEEVLIDVGGVGWVVRCGARTLSRLPAAGEAVVLRIETQWSESTGPRLYGFLDADDRAAFVLLQSVQGVGPKAALGVLDVLPPAALAEAVARDDKVQVGRASGVGPKLALRILVELKGKPIGSAGFSIAGAAAAPAGAAPVSAAGEAVAALMGLGVAETQARRLVEQAAVALGPDASVSDLVRAGLKEMGR
ncbi:MAG: Holliday junction branch migration protein RuvA [Phenylobacterium sp.]|uniref:Holliday junction branch migration protein RuvA n=1 Tax=Phenylobacterium sp. TaxID=1871053 RepID=UPI0030185E8F